jgi:hypothetical protein
MLFLPLISCSNDAGGAPNDPFGAGGGGGGTGNVTFTVRVVYDQEQNYFFEFKPSVDVVINTITANCVPRAVTNEVVTLDGTTVYSANNPAYPPVPYDMLAVGEQWTFVVAGKIGSAQGASFSVNANCTVQ